MKFSWQLTNSFLNINEKNFKEIESKLILSGIEVDSVTESQKDTIIDLSITANRKEINCSLSLAREISILTNTSIKIKPIALGLRKNKLHSRQIQRPVHINYIRVNVLDEKKYTRTPDWLLEFLKTYNQDTTNTIEDVQKYITIKWGETFNIIRCTNVHNQLIEDKLEKDKEFILSTLYKYKNQVSNNKVTLLIFKTERYVNNNNFLSYDQSIFYENYYLNTMTIIKTITQCTIGKYYENYEESAQINSGRIKVQQKTLNNWLGSTESKKIKFLKVQKTIEILKNLLLFPVYIQGRKIFIVEIPKHRSHDLRRDIDIIEEIGRLYEFKNFYSTHNYNISLGYKSNNFKKINDIRTILRSLGLNEVINCSLTNNIHDSGNQIDIYNPITQEQTELRTSITESLIKNYIHHTKYSNTNILIFEIGKIFHKNNELNSYSEKKHLGGLVYAPIYSRSSWLQKPAAISLFHTKGLIELFVYKTGAEVYMEEISADNEYYIIKDKVKISSAIGIYSKKNNRLLGTLGELKQKYLKQYHNKNHKIYLFEFELTEFINTIQAKRHLAYNKKVYSAYPSITRDISIRIKNETYIRKIKSQIESINRKFIECVEIFNEYEKYDITNLLKERFIGIRITYRSTDKTLNTADIKSINDTLNTKFNISE